jgi:hypothetical protein
VPISALKPVQIAYHVPDPERAAIRCAERFGWGPFFLLEHIPLASCLYRGRPEVFDHSSAYGQAGEMLIELITHHGTQPSALRVMYASDETGVHHVAYFVPVLAEALGEYREKGYEIAMEARTSVGVEFAMVDARADLGHMLEFYESRKDLADFYSYVKRKAHGWDGHDPVRRLTA